MARKTAKRCSLLRNIMPAQKADKIIDVSKNLRFECINHSPYLADLAYLTISPFPNLKGNSQMIQR